MHNLVSLPVHHYFVNVVSLDGISLAECEDCMWHLPLTDAKRAGGRESAVAVDHSDDNTIVFSRA